MRYFEPFGNRIRYIAVFDNKNQTTGQLTSRFRKLRSNSVGGIDGQSFFGGRNIVSFMLSGEKM